MKRKIIDRSPVAAQFSDFICSKNVDFNYAVTLTLNTDLKDREVLSKELRHFFNRLNKYVSGKANWFRSIKHDENIRLKVVPVIEDGKGRKRMHAHCAFEFPKSLPTWKITLLIHYCWGKTRFGRGALTKTKEITNKRGWFEYMGKELTSRNTDAFDVKNTYFGREQINEIKFCLAVRSSG